MSAPRAPHTAEAQRALLIEQLEVLNARFYERYAEPFDGTRMGDWAGWSSMIEALPKPLEGLHVLDVGCGNARLARALKRSQASGEGREVASYTGLDRCEALLKAASARLQTHPLPFEVSLMRWDWREPLRAQLSSPSTPRGFEWVTLFGVTHHLFSFERRLQLLTEAAEALAPGGVLSVSFWDFAASPRWEKKLLPWSPLFEAWRAQGLELTPSLLEPHDYLLGWGGSAEVPRYCHWVSPEEEEALSAQLCAWVDDLEVLRVSRDPGGYNRYREWRFNKEHD